MRKFTYAIALGFLLAMTGCEKESVSEEPKASSIKTAGSATQQNSSGCDHGDNHNPPANHNY